MPEVLTPQQIAQARTLVGPLSARMLVMMCDSHEQLRLDREVLKAQVKRLYAELDECRRALGDGVSQ